MTTIIDTGPLVALLYGREQYHQWTIAQVATRPGPFYTCEAVLTEAHFLLQRIPQGTQRLIELTGRGVLNLDYSYAAHQSRVDALMRRYQNVPMSFADACLVNLAEQLEAATILTIDSDFRIYRRHRNQALSLIIP